MQFYFSIVVVLLRPVVLDLHFVVLALDFVVLEDILVYLTLE